MCAMVYNVHVWNYFLSILRIFLAQTQSEKLTSCDIIEKLRETDGPKLCAPLWVGAMNQLLSSNQENGPETTQQSVQQKKFIKLKWTTSDKEYR